ncbi:MAG: hypothetical protein HYT73_03165 [Candidatus Aenigmarchaeota archaeon]|nr:hypothetical protein [Candidatus Aenigmarchaeota archaeon]
MLIHKVENILDRNGYNYCEYRGCFDIAARKKGMLLLKVLNNIDSFQEIQAKNLKILTREIDADAMIVGSTTRREVLSDNIVYERFEIPAISVSTFESFVENEAPVLYRRRGGLFVDINPEAMRKRRQKSGMTQEVLASRMNVTKKSVYEHERSPMKMSYESAVLMEGILGKGIIEKAKITVKSAGERNYPESRFESFVSKNLEKKGFRTGMIRRSPINIVAEEGKFSIISEADEVPRRIEKNAASLKKFSELSGKPVIAISKTELKMDIPSVDEKSLASMNARELKRFVRKW